MLCDNQGAIALSKDNNFHSRVKHIDLHYHFSREAVDEGKIMFNTYQLLKTSQISSPKHYQDLNSSFLSRGCQLGLVPVEVEGKSKMSR